jgi:V8-like Glu-specific endopeptidase
MKVLAFATATFATVISFAGCSSNDARTSTQTQGVQGGSVDTTHNYAIGVCVGNSFGQCQLLCSGALLAPNLVMTARHCVQQPTSDTINCASTTFGAQYATTNYFYITTYYVMQGQATQGWHHVKQIFTTPGTLVCGNDMALLELADNVTPAETSTFVTPVVQYSMTDHTRYSTTVTAIGYGNTSATNMDAGTRHILQNVDLLCIPGDSEIDCGNTNGQVTNNEFVSGNSTCDGDSGSSAYEQKNFNKSIPVSFGPLSRGGSSGSTCEQPVYTRTDAWSSFIVSTALTAATAGGYTPPAWTQAAPPDDGGTTTTPDSSTTSDGAAPPPPGSLGAPCGDASDCDSGLCLSNDGGTTYVCSQTCDPNGDGSDCGDGYACQGDGQGNGYCFPKPPDTTSTTSSGGCAVGTSDPSKPVPWRTLAFSAVFLGVALARTRRRR